MADADLLRRAAAVVGGHPAGVPVAVVTDGDDVLVAGDPDDVIVAGATDLDDAMATIERGGFWVGWLSYDTGRAVESITARLTDDRDIPDIAFVRFARVERVCELAPLSDATRPDVALGAMTSSLTRCEHRDAVHEIHELLRAGDVYQVNLTRRLHSPVPADGRALFGALAAHNPAPHAALVTIGGVTVVCASPERLLRIDDRALETAPIKGTAPDRATLRASAKDAAEHVMIVDLARNDLGRVARAGTVCVDALGAIEAHPGLHHMVSRVRAERRADATLADVVRAVFPPASVTGAPKPRVLQAIEDLEPVRRGIYCGAVGWVDAGTCDGALHADLAVAIRTFTITEAGTDLGVGGGIVIDSDADREWVETELKAHRLLRAAGGFEAAVRAGTSTGAVA